MALNDFSDTSITVNASSKISLSEDIPIELIQRPSKLLKSRNEDRNEETNEVSNFSYIQFQIELLKQEMQENNAKNVDFQRNIQKTLEKNMMTERDHQDILYENIVKLEKENECLKEEIKNQKEIIKLILTDQTKERWINVERKSNTNKNEHSEKQIPCPVNLNNRFENLEEPNVAKQQDNETTPKNAYFSIPLENTKSKARKEKQNNSSFRQAEKPTQRRPNVCTTEKYLENSKDLHQPKRTVPGPRSYASATKYGKKVMVVGDSHVKRIRRNLFNNSFENARSYLKSFSGAKTEDMKHYIIPSLNEQNPDVIVIHVGGNDINFRNKDNINEKELAKNIINVAMICRNSGVPDVLISEILPKKSNILTAIIRRVNDELQELCKEYNFSFISNKRITRNFLCHDGVHLTDDGTRILAGNMVNFINDFILYNRNSDETF